jgi:hypothetical protein
VDPQSPAVDAAVAVQAALMAWEAAKAASNLAAEPLLAVHTRRLAREAFAARK